MKSNLLLITITTLLSQLSFELPCKALPCTTASGLSLIRCGITEKGASASQITQILKNKQIKQPSTKEIADAIMTKVIDAINRGDASVLAQYLDRGDAGVEFATAALADYKYYFKGEKLVRFELDEVEESLASIHLKYKFFGSLKYKVYSSTGISKEIYVYQEGTENAVSRIRVYDDFLSYSARAKGLLKFFIKYIQQKNPQKLAGVLTIDDIDYPVVEAKKVILNYEAKFNVNTLKYRFDGVDSMTGGFLYTIYGLKGKKTVENKVKVGHGDGLVGLSDKLIP